MPFASFEKKTGQLVDQETDQNHMDGTWEFFVDQKRIWSTKKNFGIPKRNLVDQKFPETDQKFPETGQFFFGRPKTNEKKTGQLVDQ